MQEGEGAKVWGKAWQEGGNSVVRELFAEHSCAVLSASDPSSRPLSPLPKMIPAVILLLLLLVEQAGKSVVSATELGLSVGIKDMDGGATSQGQEE